MTAVVVLELLVCWKIRKGCLDLFVRLAELLFILLQESLVVRMAKAAAAAIIQTSAVIGSL